MFLTVVRSFLRKAHSRHKSSRNLASRRRLTCRPELEMLEDRLTPTADYTNLAVSGAVIVLRPVDDVKIEFSPTPGSSFTLTGDAHDVTVIGGIPAGDAVHLNGDVHDVTIGGTIAGSFILTGSGYDFTMGKVSGTVTIGASATGSIHDFTAGEVTHGAHFSVIDAFYAGTVGPDDAGSVTFFNPDHHSLPPAANLTLTNSVDNQTPLEGSVVHFTVTVQDNGPSNATGLQITDLLPAGLTLQSAASPSGTTYNSTTGVWNIGSLNNGSTDTLTLTGSVNLGTGGETFTSTASITAENQTNTNTPSVSTLVTVLQPASPPTNLAISPNTGISAGLTDTGAVTFTGTLGQTGETVDVFDTSTNTDLGGATVIGTSFSLALNLAEGSHMLRARASLAGTTADGFFSVLVDLTPPTSHAVNNLGAQQTSDRFPVSVSFSDPVGSGGAPASGVASVDLYLSTTATNGPYALYQTQTLTTPETSGTVTFTFAGSDRTTYYFYSVAHDAAGNTESKASSSETTTYVPDLNPPVTHVISPSPGYSWAPFPSSFFSGISASSYNSSTGVFTLYWAGADPDQPVGGSIASLSIYVSIDGGNPSLVGTLVPGNPNANGVYSGYTTYQAMADGNPHAYSFWSVGTGDMSNKQYAPAAGPATPDVSFTETF
jgi:uncharacterized repeat protein (TIGR01451 family)